MMDWGTNTKTSGDKKAVSKKLNVVEIDHPFISNQNRW